MLSERKSGAAPGIEKADAAPNRTGLVSKSSPSKLTSKSYRNNRSDATSGRWVKLGDLADVLREKWGQA